MKKFAFTLTEVFSPHCVEYRKSAFTLAEVLITLGIIGIVASMTIPGLITNYQKHYTVNALKQAYTTLYQAIELANQELEPLEVWSDTEFRNTYLLPYLKNATAFNSNPYKKQILWRDNSGTTSCCIDGLDKNCIESSQGYYYCLKNNYQDIWIDLNGSKGPNRLGRDLFLASIVKNKSLNKYELEFYSWYIYKTANTKYYQHCNKTSGNNSACGLKILKDGWQIKDDYPW